MKVDDSSNKDNQEGKTIEVNFFPDGYFDQTKLEDFFNENVKCSYFLLEKGTEDVEDVLAAIMPTVYASIKLLEYCGRESGVDQPSLALEILMMALSDRIETGVTPRIFEANKELTAQKIPRYQGFLVKNTFVFVSHLFEDQGLNTNQALEKTIELSNKIYADKKENLGPKTTSALRQWRENVRGAARSNNNKSYTESYETFCKGANDGLIALDIDMSKPFSECKIESFARGILFKAGL